MSRRFRDAAKVVKVIESCCNHDHLHMALKLSDVYDQYYGTYTMHFFDVWCRKVQQLWAQEEENESN